MSCQVVQRNELHEGLNVREDDKADLEFLTLARAGQADAVAMLVRRHTARVRSIVYPMVLNHADADDVTQETLVKTIGSLSAFRGEAGFSTWVHRIAVNTALNFIKRHKRQATEVADEEALAQIEDTAVRPADRLEAQETDAAISGALARLSPEQRAAVSLVALQGMDEREAAMAAGCPAATLRWRLHAARKKLKNLLRNLRAEK